VTAKVKVIVEKEKEPETEVPVENNTEVTPAADSN
jgi:hypothetical protein